MSEIEAALSGNLTSEIDSALGPVTPNASVSDYAKQFGASVIEGVGSIPQFGGEIVAAGLNRITGTQDWKSSNPLAPVTDYIRDKISPGGKAAMQDAPKGDILDPDTWELPKTGSGLGMGLAQGVGSLASYLLPLGAAKLAGAAGKGFVGSGALAGGAITGGQAAGATRADFEKLKDEDWATIPAYNEAVSSGMDVTTAKSKVTNDSALYSGAFSALAGAVGGGFNAKVLQDIIAKKGIARLLGNVSEKGIVRAAVGTGVGGVGEGLQEGLEQVGQNVGENLGRGDPALKDATRDTFGNVVYGALIGGPVGSLAGVASNPTITTADLDRHVKNRRQSLNDKHDLTESEQAELSTIKEKSGDQTAIADAYGLSIDEKAKDNAANATVDQITADANGEINAMKYGAHNKPTKDQALSLLDEINQARFDSGASAVSKEEWLRQVGIDAPVFPFKTPAAAARQAEALTQKTGIPYAATAHPTAEGSFAALPADFANDVQLAESTNERPLVDTGTAGAEAQPAAPGLESAPAVDLGGTQQNQVNASQAEPEQQGPQPQVGKRRIATPDDVAREQFLAATKTEGISEEVASRIFQAPPRDSVTGFHDFKAGNVKAQSVQRAIDHVTETGDEAHLIAYDIGNLGGLNAHHNNDSAAANKDYRALTDIALKTLESAGADVTPGRTGGDEGLLIVSGLDSTKLKSAVAQIKSQISAYVNENGLVNIAPGKLKGAGGLSLHIGTSRINKGDDVSAVISRAEAGMDNSKRGGKDVNRVETGASGPATPDRQAGGVKGGTVAPDGGVRQDASAGNAGAETTAGGQVNEQTSDPGNAPKGVEGALGSEAGGGRGNSDLPTNAIPVDKATANRGRPQASQGELPGRLRSGENPAWEDLKKPDKSTRTFKDEKSAKTFLRGNKEIDTGYAPREVAKDKWVLSKVKKPKTIGMPKTAYEKDISQPEIDDVISLSSELGHAEKGGFIIRGADGEVTGRTKFVPRSPFWPGRPEPISEKLAAQAFEKLKAGQPLSAIQKRFIDYTREYLKREKGAFISEEVDLQKEAIAQALDEVPETENLDADSLQAVVENAQDLAHDISWSAKGEVADEQFMRAIGFTEEEVNEARNEEANQSETGQAAAREQDASRTPDAEGSQSAQEPAQDRPGAVATPQTPTETPPPSGVSASVATKEPWQMTRAEFEAAAKRGKNIKATGVRVAGEESARTPLRMGELNKYGSDNIAHFYASRRGYPNSASETYDPLDAGREQLIQDAIAEGKPVPAEVLADYPDLKENNPKNQGELAASGFVDIDSLPNETKNDITYVLQEKVAAFSGMDESDIWVNIFDMADEVVVERKTVPVDSIKMEKNRGISKVAVSAFAKLTTEAPPILVDGVNLLEGGHRLQAAIARGDKTIGVIDVGPLLSADWGNWLENGSKKPSDPVRSNLPAKSVNQKATDVSPAGNAAQLKETTPSLTKPEANEREVKPASEMTAAELLRAAADKMDAATKPAEDVVEAHPAKEADKPVDKEADQGTTPLYKRTNEAPRATGLSASEVRQFLKPILPHLRAGVTVVQSVAEAREKTGINSIPHDAAGFAYKGKIYIITDNINDELDLLKTIFHEAFHVGFRAAFKGDISGYTKALRVIGMRNGNILKAARAWRTSFGNDALAMYQNDHGMTEAKAKEAVLSLSIEEALAELSGKNVEIKGISQFLAAIQKFLRSIANGKFSKVADWLESLSNAEALAVIREARGNVLHDGPQALVAAPAYSQNNPIWYSELSRKVNDLKFETAPAAMWKGAIKNLTQKGVKADEIEFTGINEWLDLQQGKVTKDAVLDFLRGNGVQIKDVVLGDIAANRGGEVRAAYDKYRSDMQEKYGEGYWQKMSDEERAEYSQLETDVSNAMSEAAKTGGDTKFATYQLPGGENYRELLLTLPEKKNDITKRDEAYTAFDRGEISRDERNRRIEAATAPSGNNFKSSHFDQPNILSHVRFNERTDADGKRVLFLEEIQSDWAQKGRKEGFSEPLQIRERKIGGTTVYEVIARDGSVYSEEITLASAKLVSSKAASDVPSAPFVTKTEAWAMLAMKRMIRYAADNGFDRIAWTTGEQQAARYDLSKHIDTIIYNADGRLTALKGRKEVLRGQYSEKDLPEVIGKDATEKLLSTKPQIHGTRRLDGADLKVGGEGMRTFYDRIIPNVANDILKKMGGGRVESVDLNIMSETPVFNKDTGKDVYQNQIQPGFTLTESMRETALQGMPAFSRNGDSLSALKPKNIRNEVASLFESTKTFNLLHRTIGTQYHKAQIDKDFENVYDLAQSYTHDLSTFANSAADLAPTLLTNIKSLSDVWKRRGVNQADVDAASSAIFEGTLDKKLYSVAELKENGKTDKQIGLYQEARKAIDYSLDTLLTAEAARLARGTGINVDAAKENPSSGALAISDALAELSKETEDPKESEHLLGIARMIDEKQQRIAQLKNEGYAPLSRFGKYTAYVNNAEGESEYFGMYESERNRNKAVAALQAEFPDSAVTVGIMSQEAYKLFQGISPDTLEIFADMLHVTADGEQISLGKTDVFQEYLKLAVNNRSAMKRLIHRKDVPGFSTDLPRVLANFITSNARASSGNYHFGDLLDSVNSIPKEKGDVKDEAYRLMHYIQNPQEEAAKLRGFLFINYLGGSVASAMVNMTQPLLQTFPFLSQFGTAQAATALIKGMGSATTGKGIDPQLAQALKRAEKGGVVSPQEIHQLYAEGNRTFGSNPLLRKALVTWGAFFSLAEQFNRKSTFIAAFNMAREQGMPDPFAFAEKAVHETQGVYNKSNRPNWGRGPVGATLMTFKQFSISYVEFLVRLPAKQRVLALAILALVSGLQGLPGADDLDDIIDTIAQSLGYNWSTKEKKRKFIADALGKDFAEFILHGASTLPGVPLDIQGRLGMGNLVPGTALLKKSEVNKGRDIIGILGPAGGLADSVGNALEKAQSGNFSGAAKQLTPVAIQNALKGMEMLQMGMYRDQKGRKVLDTDALDAFTKGVGFQPSEAAKQSRKIGQLTQQVALTRKVEGDIAATWSQGIFEQDPSKIQEARKDLIEWNLKNPETPIRIIPSQIARRVAEMRSTRERRVTKSATREIRGEVARQLQ